MKTYLSVGIGDMMCLDSLLHQEERDRISEIYWACRFGRDIIPLFHGNNFYPNLKGHYTIPDEVGFNEMVKLEGGVSGNFWHFRPDFERNFSIGLNLFGISHLRNELNVINAAQIFMDRERVFTNSSFLDSAVEEDVDWNSLGVSPKEYILFHFPTSTRPRTDIATIVDSDWIFIDELSKKENLKVIVITDTEIENKLTNAQILSKPNIKTVIALCKFAKFYAGCDSFASILSCKVLEPQRLFIKSHDQNIQKTVLSNVWLQRFFQPHSPSTISTFYKNYIGY